MTGLSPLIVNLNGLLIDGQTADPDGNVWDTLLFDGWWDPPTSKVTTAEVTPIGETVTVARFEARAIAAQFLAHNKVNGWPLGSVALFQAIKRIKSVLEATLAPVPMYVTDPIQNLQSQIRLNTGMKVAIQGDRGAVTFNVPILCPDPRRYNQTPTIVTCPCTGTSTDSGGIIMTNQGDLDTPPVVTIYGPAVNPLIQNDSIPGTPNVKWNATLGGGDVLVIDMAACTIIRNGSQNMILDLDPNSRFWQLQPGANVIHYHRDSGASLSACNLNYRDAYS
jgi:hypothetical protein